MYGSICSCRLAQSFERKKLDQAERGEKIERNRLTERQNGLFQAASTAKYRVAERNLCRLSSSYLGLLFFCLFWAEFEEGMFVRFSFVQVCFCLVLYIALRPGTSCCPTPVIRSDSPTRPVLALSQHRVKFNLYVGPEIISSL